jgi:hypothetical protein
VGPGYENVDTRVGLDDGLGDRSRLIVAELQSEPTQGVALQALCRELAAGESQLSIAKPVDVLLDESAKDIGRCRGGCALRDEPPRTLQNLRGTIQDQLWLGWEIVVNGLLGDIGGARDIRNGHCVIAVLSEEHGGDVAEPMACL